MVMDVAAWDARYAAADLVWGGQPNRFVAEQFAGQRPGRALDLGAGEGRNAVWLARLGWQVTAVDFSPVAVDRGRRLASERGMTVDWVQADLRDYRPDPAAFDAVVIAYLHLAPADRTGVLRRAVTALAPGGTLFVVGHDLINLDEGTGGPQAPDLLYTPERIAGDLSDLTVTRAERVHREVATPAGTARAVDTLVCARRPATVDPAATAIDPGR
jgi:SAM-dependent methyltransferase